MIAVRNHVLVTMEVIIYKRGSRKTHSARKPQAFERTNNTIHSLTYGALCPIIVARILKSWIRFDAIAAKCPPPLPSLKSLVSRSHGNFPITVEKFARQSFRLSSVFPLSPFTARVESLFLRSFIVSRFYRQTSCKSTERSL